MPKERVCAFASILIAPLASSEVDYMPCQVDRQDKAVNSLKSIYVALCAAKFYILQVTWTHLVTNLGVLDTGFV